MLYLKCISLKIPSVKTTEPTPSLVKQMESTFQHHHFMCYTLGIYVHLGFEFWPGYSLHWYGCVSVVTRQKGTRSNLWSGPNRCCFAGIFARTGLAEFVNWWEVMGSWWRLEHQCNIWKYLFHDLSQNIDRSSNSEQMFLWSFVEAFPSALKQEPLSLVQQRFLFTYNYVFVCLL